MSDAYQTSGNAAYGAQQSKTLAGRVGEAHAFTESARLLHDAQSRSDRAAAVRALRHNLNLWTQVQAEISQPDHPMSPAVKNDILRLSVFVDRRTIEALANPDFALLDALVEINRNLAQGQLAAAPGP